MTGRYVFQPFLEVPQSDGSTRRMSTPRISGSPRADIRYTVQAGDRLDLLAGRALADSTRWWAIADANPQADALALEEPGTPMAVPDA